MTMSRDDRFATFKPELERIESQVIREFAMECLAKVPEYFFVACPSSSSGKYHPSDELSGNGSVLHTKRVCRLIPEFTAAYDVQHNNDLLLCAGILHDSFKQGVKKSGHTMVNHPLLAADSAAEVYKSDVGKFIGITRDEAAMIYRAVLYHMGKWGKGKCAKSLCDYSREEMCVHLADVAASRSWVKVALT